MEQDNQENALDDLEVKWRRIANLVGTDKAPTLAELAYYDQQRELAATGQALNQCPSCGSYRIDGQPPILHKPDCLTRQASS